MEDTLYSRPASWDQVPLMYNFHAGYSPDQGDSDVVVQGYALKFGSGLFNKWEKKYFMLYPNRLEFADNIQVRG